VEKPQTQKYAESLEKTIRNLHDQLKKTLEDFQEMCRIVDPARHFPQEIVVDIREAYKTIQEKLKEIKSIELLLQGKYRQYYHRNSLRDRELGEIAFVAKNAYSKVEYTLLQIETMRKMKEKERLEKEKAKKEESAEGKGEGEGKEAEGEGEGEEEEAEGKEQEAEEKEGGGIKLD
jgi:hypothetical protein